MSDIKKRNAEFALELLAIKLRLFSADELRWDFHCNIHDPQKALILVELQRRGEPTDGPRSRRGGAAGAKSAHVPTDCYAAAIAACRAVVEANNHGMTAEEGREAVAMCEAAVAKADGATK